MSVLSQDELLAYVERVRLNKPPRLTDDQLTWTREKQAYTKDGLTIFEVTAHYEPEPYLMIIDDHLDDTEWKYKITKMEWKPSKDLIIPQAEFKRMKAAEAAKKE